MKRLKNLTSEEKTFYDRNNWTCYLVLRWLCTQLSIPVVQSLHSFKPVPTPPSAMQGVLPPPPPSKNHYLLVFLAFTVVMPLRIPGNRGFWETEKTFKLTAEKRIAVFYMDAVRRGAG